MLGRRTAAGVSSPEQAGQLLVEGQDVALGARRHDRVGVGEELDHRLERQHDGGRTGQLDAGRCGRRRAPARRPRRQGR